MTGFEETEMYMEYFNYWSYRKMWFLYLPLRYLYIDFDRLMFATKFRKVKPEELGTKGDD